MHRMCRRVYGTLTLGIVAATGCSASKTAGPSPTSTGSLTVTVNAPQGFSPSVVITGPNSFSTTITATKTLSGLAVGTYTIVADSAVGPDSVVGTDVDTSIVTGSPATVASGATATATVSYAVKHQVGGLWLANVRYGTIAELSANQLRHSGSPVPAETLATKVSSPAGLALDASGNMWESSMSSDSLLMYTPAARNAGGGTAPSTVLVSTALSSLIGVQMLAFDAHGNLWVANYGAGSILEFTASELAAGGAQIPAVTINGGTVLISPTDLAFDGNGNVWVSDGSNTRIVEYSAQQLGVAGASTPTPIGMVSESGGTEDGTLGLAFDAKGNLWAANNTSNTVVEYTAAQLVAGATAPNAIVTLPVSVTPLGIAFDKRGTLWVTSFYNGVIYGLTSGQLVTGSPTPAVADTVHVSGGFQPDQPLFDPYATATGVSAARAH